MSNIPPIQRRRGTSRRGAETDTRGSSTVGALAGLVGLGIVAFAGCQPFDSRHDEVAVAQNLTISSTHETGFVGNWFYTHWKDAGSASQTLNADGTFSISWQGGSYNYVGGPGWNYGLKSRVVGYNLGTDSGASYVSLYGWSMNPLVEYYILQRWKSDPTAGATQGVTFTSNGVQYTAYRTQRTTKPSINGTQTFYQFWSKPTSQRSLGTNYEIKFADHAAAWAASGWTLGNMQSAGTDDATYQVLAIEVFGPPSAGSASGKVWDATPSPTCSDSVQNQGETGVDCGGPCGVCAASSWLQGEIGGAAPGGGYSVSNGTFSVQGGGADIGGTSDQFHYAYKQVTGDATIIARATALTNTNQWAKAGVMIRETLNANSAFAMMQMRPDGYVQNQHRTSAGTTSGGASSTLGTTGTPKWLKVQRTGDTFVLSYSSNGTTWTQASSQAITMASTVYVGLVSCSHTTSNGAAAAFDNVSVTASAGPSGTGGSGGTGGAGGTGGSATGGAATGGAATGGAATGGAATGGAATGGAATGGAATGGAATGGAATGGTGTGGAAATGGSGTTPCASLCSPIVTKTGQSQQSGNLGTGAICNETTGVTFAGANCSNMTGRTITVNGTAVNCNGWAIPAKRNNGYCIQVSAGGQSYAAYSTW